jgi:hypothetical protein
MAKHEAKELTLNQIINRIDALNPNKWYEIVGIDIPGLDEVYQAAVNNDSDDDPFELYNKIEADYLEAHGSDRYRVSWPEHVTFPRFNNDAFYTRISEV